MPTGRRNGVSGERHEGVLSWDESYMDLARRIAGSRSKDPCTQVGAFISDQDHRPLSMGYNGTPRGWDDRDFPWGKGNHDDRENKYRYVVHAERNAILNAPGGTRSLKGSTMYVTLFPCSECAKEIAQAGVARLVYGDIRDGDDTDASLRILRHAGVDVEPLR